MKRIVAGVLLSVLCFDSLALAVDSKGASYFGGTVSTFKEAKKPIEGRLDTRSDDALVFAAEDKPVAGQMLSIPCASIIDIEYGQKAGRRVGAAAATTILLGPIGLLALLSKKRSHFLTVGFKDNDGKDQVAVLELQPSWR